MCRERAQALVETVVAVPACVASALALVDCGIIIRDRMAIAQAASRAAEAQIAGTAAPAAARGALPDQLHSTLSVDVRDDRVVVGARSRTALTRLAGIDAEHTSVVKLEAPR